MVTSGGGYRFLVGNWLPLGQDPHATLGINQSGCQGAERGDKGRRIDGWLSSGWSFVGKSGRPWHMFKSNGLYIIGSLLSMIAHLTVQLSKRTIHTICLSHSNDKIHSLIGKLYLVLMQMLYLLLRWRSVGISPKQALTAFSKSSLLPAPEV